MSNVPAAEQDALAEHMVPMLEIYRATTTFIEILIKKEVHEASNLNSLNRCLKFICL